MKLVSKTVIQDDVNYYDITIDNHHNFVLSNGAVAHNCGTGVGFSVERQHVNKLPEVAEEFFETDTVIVVPDSKIGWAKSFRELISLCYVGHIPKWDLSKLRPAGAPLKIFGGRSSGPRPLNDLFDFTVSLFKKAAGRKLSSLECHDLACKIAEIVVCGGVRRSALISLSNLSDDRMRTSKSGQWWVENPQRALANNSAAYTEKPEFEVFMKEWVSLYESKSGERGIFSRVAADKKVKSSERREVGYDWVTNPCTSGDTLILTKDGNQKIEDCVGKEVEVWNGESFEKVIPFSTGVNDTLKIVFSNGVSLRATYYHEFVLSSGETVEAQDLIAGDMLYPFLLPDGREQCAYVSLISEDDPCETFCFTEEKTGRGTFNGLVTKQCGEIILRPNEFCNLSEVIVRPDDTLESLKDKVKSATILGTFQSTLTDFRYLRKIWKKNVEEERLLGVSITGVMDHKVLGDYNNKDLPNWLSELRSVAVEENKKWAEKLGINQSVSVTTQKPSGTCSQLCNTSSGIHPRYSPYYVRTVRADGKDPLAQLMIDQGFPYEIDVMNDKNYVFSFPVKSPDHAKTTEDISAMDQLKLWLVYQEYWCEHNPSCTIYYRDDEFLELGSFVWNNFDKITGVSFLPHSDHVYKQAPYQPITKEEYEKLLEEFPQEVNWDVLGEYESEDNTAGSQTLACSGGVCEVVDLTEK